MKRMNLLRTWYRNLRLRNKLLLAGAAALLPLALVSLGGGWYFRSQVRAAQRLVTSAACIRIATLEARRAEKDFMLRDWTTPGFYESGDAASLRKHREAVAALKREIAALAEQLPAADRAAADKLRGDVEIYDENFRALVEAYRQRGFQDYGCEGEFRRIAHRMLTAAQQRGDLVRERDLLRLRSHEKDFILRKDTENVRLVKEDLSRLGAAAPGGDVAEYGQAFRKYAEQDERIGFTENEGFQGAMRRAVHAVDEDLSRMGELEAAAVKGGATAERRFFHAQGAALLAGLFASFLIFGLFARSLAAAVRSLQLAAAALGEGDLTVQAEIATGDEIGNLAASFNRMAENLRSVLHQVETSGGQVMGASGSVASTSHQLAAAVTEQNAATGEVSANARGISTTAQELSAQVRDVSEAATATAAVANRSHEEIARMSETMQRLNAATGDLSGKLARLSEKAAGITTVVTAMNKVADQTNLLSLNAAIEAEKAGEFGRGFSVVAREISRLADQSAAATTDIAQTVGEIQSAVAAGVMEMDRFAAEVRQSAAAVAGIAEQLAQMAKSVQALSPRFATVAGGVQAQAEAAEQISHAMTQLAAAAGQTGASAKSLEETAARLDQSAQVMTQEVSRFRLT